ncbi:MAG: DUF1326 domain-containing protein [Candidatus Poribacteria bacterium]|nr:DUF1326 domain-containing protein [Candidatus Poribacteria bacterium]
MKGILVLTTLALTLIAGFAFATEAPTVQGEYIEARSASVYVGACHFGSEFVEGGREATAVWNIQSGSWNNVSLENLTVVAVISAKNNLAIDTETRKSVLYMDASTTPEQRAALKDMLTTKRADVLGKVVATQTASVEFSKEGTKYDVKVGKVLALSANRYPCAGCTQPHQIWYKPLTTIQNAIVGKSEVYRYKDTHLPVTWQQSGAENNIFVGGFSM